MKRFLEGGPHTASDPYLLLKDTIRSELEPLRHDVASVTHQIAGLREDLREVRASVYTREMVDEKLLQATGCHEGLRKDITQVRDDLDNHLNKHEGAIDTRLLRIGVLAAVLGTALGLLLQFNEAVFHVFGP